jgi:hypothetical protein
MKGGAKMGQTPFDVNVRHDGTMDIVTIRGEVDLDMAPLRSDAFAGLEFRGIRRPERSDLHGFSSELAVLLRQKAQMNGGERVRQLLGPTRLKTATSPSPTRSTVARASNLKMSK